MSANKTLLIILDGWGLGPESPSNAIHAADTPFMDQLLREQPHSKLLTDGENVGLPAGQMGNSEVGHLNIGAGRVVFQDLVRINKAIEDGSFAKNPALLNAFEKVKKEGRSLHLVGLVSEGGIHSHQNHLNELCKQAKKNGLKNVWVHAFTDGRDTDPKNAHQYIAKLQDQLKATTGQLASVIGRYYAMDRDQRWERIQVAYELLTQGKGKPYQDPLEGILDSYKNGITDEFIKPVVAVDQAGNPIGTIKKGDVVLCFNFRTDRCRQITQALTQRAFPKQGMQPMNLHYLTMTVYDRAFQSIFPLFDKENISNSLGEVLSQAGKKQLRIAETEKYPHVTYFFSGGREQAFEGEKRIMIPSPKVPTYDLQPEMSALELTQAIKKELQANTFDFICLNFANPDMVGHTGNFEAIKKAVEVTDQCAQEVVKVALAKGYTVLLTADHGNADCAVNPDGTPNTAHTVNAVPFIVLGESGISHIENGVLADIAPTLLKLMGIEAPEQMTGKVLVKKT